MEKNKTGKYFKYAVGEIVLVVFGILIALSINNWNSHRIQKAETLEICKRLVIENDLNKIELISDIKQLKGIIDKETSLIKMMGPDFTSKNTRTVDSLVSFALIQSNYNYKQSVLDQSLSGNQLSISSKELKNLIYTLPASIDKFKTSEKNIATFNLNYLTGTLMSIYSIRNMDAVFTQTMKGIGKSELAKDQRLILTNFEFENNLDNKTFLDHQLLNLYRDFLNTLENFSTLLKKEIENLN